MTEVEHIEWRCEECGAGHVKNAPPCNECGGMQFETVSPVRNTPSTADDRTVEDYRDITDLLDDDADPAVERTADGESNRYWNSSDDQLSGSEIIVMMIAGWYLFGDAVSNWLGGLNGEAALVLIVYGYVGGRVILTLKPTVEGEQA